MGLFYYVLESVYEKFLLLTALHNQTAIFHFFCCSESTHPTLHPYLRGAQSEGAIVCCFSWGSDDIMLMCPMTPVLKLKGVTKGFYAQSASGNDWSHPTLYSVTIQSMVYYPQTYLCVLCPNHPPSKLSALLRTNEHELLHRLKYIL